MGFVPVILIIIFFLALTALVRSVRIVNQYEKGLVMRFGKYQRTVGSGINILVPFVESILAVDMRERVLNVDPQDVITKDNVAVIVDAVVYYKVIDPVKAEFEIQNFAYAATTLAQTNMRNIVGELALDETLISRDIINNNLRSVLDEATNPWGVKITRVEVQKIQPPKDIEDAMSKQMKAEREKRAEILTAEGYKTSQILRAEGDKESAILKSEGQAQAVERVAEAAEKFLTPRALELRKIEMLEKTLQNNTKYIIPSGSNLINILDLEGTGIINK
ncbi:MAG: SPFH/Band 7/PHB domain protein [bacterium]|nr:SPFH/Band 7/PHB domain protein [bacterium]